MLLLGIVSSARVAAGDTTAPVINSASYDDPTQTLTLDITEDSGSVTVHVVGTASGATPTISEIIAGTGGGILEAATDYVATTGSNSDSFDFTNESIVELHIVAEDAAGNTDIAVVTGVVVDNTAPVLSAQSATETGATTANASVTSDEASGTIFFAARLSTDGVLTLSEIENGTGNAVSTASDATPMVGGNGADLTGLTASTTYIVDMFQRDAYGNESAMVSSGSFTTTAVTNALTVFTPQYSSGTGTTHTFTFTGLAAEKTMVIACSNDGTADISSATLDGNAMADITAGGPITQGNISMGAFEFTLGAGGDLDVVVTSTASQTGLKCHLIQVGTSTRIDVGEHVAGGMNPTVANFAGLTYQAGDFIYAVADGQSNGGNWSVDAGWTATPGTEDSNDGHDVFYAYTDNATAAQTVELDYSTTFLNTLGIAVVYRP